MNWAALPQTPEAGTAAPSSPWLVDDFLECYVGWREESAGVRSAYDRWTTAEASDRALAHAAYVAALDREERAAHAYRECAEQIAAELAT